jgi:hypothetical protein
MTDGVCAASLLGLYFYLPFISRVFQFQLGGRRVGVKFLVVTRIVFRPQVSAVVVRAAENLQILFARSGMIGNKVTAEL